MFLSGCLLTLTREVQVLKAVAAPRACWDDDSCELSNGYPFPGPAHAPKFLRSKVHQRCLSPYSKEILTGHIVLGEGLWTKPLEPHWAEQFLPLLLMQEHTCSPVWPS